MKFNFKKISAIAASALMTGMTMGVAAAANYPAPFVSGGSANVAIVYGTGSGVSNLDFIQAGNIQESLSKSVSGGSIKVEGGESFVLEKNSNKFYLGGALNVPYSTLKKGELKNFLADGTYKDGDVNVDYTQKIELGNKALHLFTHKNYNDKEPTLGFDFSSGEKILDYKIEFKSGGVALESIEETNLPLMGKEYYVLDTTATTIELLDSANKVVIGEGESKTISGKSVSIEFVTDKGVKLNVDGEVTKMLSLNSPHELNDGTYVIINEIMYTPKESGVSKVELSVGSGKILLEDGKRVKVNKDYVKGLEVDLADDGTKLTAITLTWKSDGDSFLTEDNALRMPVPFDGISLSYQGLDFPTTYEKISIEPGEQLTLVMENYELPLMWTNGTATKLGEEDRPLILATSFNSTEYPAIFGHSGDNLKANQGLELQEDYRFLVTRMKNNDLNEVQTLYGEITSIDYDDDDDPLNIKYEVVIEDLISGKTITLDEDNLEEEIGDIEITLSGVTADKTTAYLNFAGLSGGTPLYNLAVSETGMHVTLPTDFTNFNANGVSIIFKEQTKDGDVGSDGQTITATVKQRGTGDSIHVTSVTGLSLEKETKDVSIGYVPGALASKVIFDKTKDDYEFEINYYGEEVTAKVLVIGGDTIISEGGDATLGNILVKDTEVGSVASKNLIIVGGSCINSAAAALVGGTKCGAAWTEATGIGAGEFLIKGYDDSTLTTRLALLVAGYEAEDTVKATTYLTNKVVDTSKEYKGVTSTETAVVVE